MQALAEITRSLKAQDCRLLTLIGPGGIGKTRLAIAAAQNLVVDAPGLVHFSDGVYFVRLISLNSTDQLAPAIADTLDLDFDPNLAPKEHLLGFLRNRKLLLVLDNFEHLLELEGNPTAAGLVADILSAAPGVNVLATSREALNVQGECLYPVEGMRYPSADSTPADFETYSAVQLFVQSARRVRPDFDFTANSECVLCICRLVEGMPLAIEMAAAWLKVLPCNQIASELEQNLDLLTTSLRNVPDRHRSMHAVFEHSWQLLSPSEQVILCKLSVFRGGFTLEEAEEMAGASLLDLAGLIEKSMLKATPSGLYRMHGMLRQFAAEKRT